jgi:hypothetical protein
MESMRYEYKITCDELYLPEVRSWVRVHPAAFVEAYPPRQVNSLYFDTPEANCLHDNLMGLSERRKLRFRWYGNDFTAVRGILELKCKANQLGWKRYCPIPITFDLTAISWIGLIQQMRRHAEGVLALWLSSADQPVLLTSFVREYHESIDHQIRVTVDYTQTVYEQITYSAPNLTVKTPRREQVVIEVKSDSGLPHRVSEVVSSFPLRIGRNSKYVNGVLDSLGFMNPALR